MENERLRSIQMPIIAADGLDVMMFDKVEDLCSYCEPIDVGDEVYKVYDARGTRLQLIVTPKDQIEVEITSVPGQAASELHDLLISFLDHHGGKVGQVSQTLQEAIQTAYPLAHRSQKSLRQLISGFFKRK